MRLLWLFQPSADLPLLTVSFLSVDLNEYQGFSEVHLSDDTTDDNLPCRNVLVLFQDKYFQPQTSQALMIIPDESLQFPVRVP